MDFSQGDFIRSEKVELKENYTQILAHVQRSYFNPQLKLFFLLERSHMQTSYSKNYRCNKNLLTQLSKCRLFSQMLIQAWNENPSCSKQIQ